MDEMKRIRNREEIPEEDKWAIEDLYATDAAWEEDLKTVADDQEYLASFAGKLADPRQLYAYLHRSEELNTKADRLGNYCMRKADEDTRNATYQAMQGKFMSVFVALGAATSFDTPEIMAISDEDMERFYGEYPALERYRRYLTNLRRLKAHTLSAVEEKLLAAAGEMLVRKLNWRKFKSNSIQFQERREQKKRNWKKQKLLWSLIEQIRQRTI